MEEGRRGATEVEEGGRKEGRRKEGRGGGRGGTREGRGERGQGGEAKRERPE
jgi:hypothetical protein